MGPYGQHPCSMFHVYECVHDMQARMHNTHARLNHMRAFICIHAYICLHVCICTHASIACIRNMHAHTHNMHACICIHARICMHMHVCMSALHSETLPEVTDHKLHAIAASQLPKETCGNKDMTRRRATSHPHTDGAPRFTAYACTCIHMYV